MRFKRQASIELGISRIDIVPFAGILFLLLIFFMLTSSFVSQSGIKVKSGQVVTNEIAAGSIIIIISERNAIYLDNRLTSLKELEKYLKVAANNNKRQVLIKAHRKSSLGTVTDVWNLCKDSGLSNVNIATNSD